MADPADPASGEKAFAYLLTLAIPHVVQGLALIATICERHGLMGLRDEASGILDGLLYDLNKTAVQMAGVADGMIVQKIIQTAARNRPQQSEMMMHIRSKPGPLGSVKVALIEELEKIVNPRGYGPFWRAQEYGTGSEEGVPSQEGRLLFGTFEPSGEPPDAAQRGPGQGRDLEFIPMGQAPGFGRISVELPARHFLTDGATEAGAEYIAVMKEIEAKYLGAVKALVEKVPRRALGGTFIGRIEA